MKKWFRRGTRGSSDTYPISTEGAFFCVASFLWLAGIVWLTKQATTVISVIASIGIPTVVFFVITYFVMKDRTER
jgi:hypothetical protein